MQQKVITIPFNSDFFLKSHKVIWAFSNNKKIKPNIIYTVLAIFCLIIGLALKKREDFPLFIFGAGYLFYMILIWSNFIERKIKYFKKVKKYALYSEQELVESTFIFSDEEFQYSDKEKSFRFSWFLSEPVAIYRDNILLAFKDMGVRFVISRDELGDEEYHEICNILKEKTPH